MIPYKRSRTTTRLKQKRAELLAIQAKHRAKATSAVKPSVTAEPAKVETEEEEKEKEKEKEKETERPGSEKLRSRWNKLAMSMIS